MTPVVSEVSKSKTGAQVSWWNLVWFAALLILCYAPVLASLIRQWDTDADMGHGFFVPVIAGLIVWLKRRELLSQPARPNWWGLAIVIWAALQLYIATLGAELFLARTSFVISLIGIVLLLGGTEYLRILAFPLFLLFFMVPIPAIIYNKITFPLQTLATETAETVLSLLQIPVLREGHVLELPNRSLDVVEACSGIRSLLSLTFLALVYGFFFERRTSIRAILFLATIPIAVVANASRVTLTGILTAWKPELAEGFLHTAQGWVIFMVAVVILIAFHQILARSVKAFHARLSAH